MGVRLDYNYPGVQGNQDEYPGSFVFNADHAEWSRMPAIGEAITLSGHWVARVTWVLWSVFPQDDVVIHVETHPGYEVYTPKRADLAAAGWREA